MLDIAARKREDMRNVRAGWCCCGRRIDRTNGAAPKIACCQGSAIAMIQNVQNVRITRRILDTLDTPDIATPTPQRAYPQHTIALPSIDVQRAANVFGEPEAPGRWTRSRCVWLCLAVSGSP